MSNTEQDPVQPANIGRRWFAGLAALDALRPLRDQRRAARARGRDLLGAPTIDRAALEQARAAQMQAADAASRRMAQAMADATEVLTPEQRAKAVDRMKRRMESPRRG